MKFFIIKFSVLALVIGALHPSSAFAESLHLKQLEVSEANKELDLAKQEYDDLFEKVKLYEKRIMQENDQLNTLKNKLPASEERLKKAKATLQERTKEFNKVWVKNKTSQ